MIFNGFLVKNLQVGLSYLVAKCYSRSSCSLYLTFNITYLIVLNNCYKHTSGKLVCREACSGISQTVLSVLILRLRSG